MISKVEGVVAEVRSENDDIQDILVKINNKIEKAYNYIGFTGKVNVGDRVVLNTTAVELSLGTGGFHFVIINLDNIDSKFTPGGHIMKLRYTPLQIKVNSVEEQESRYHGVFEKFETLNGMPVAVAALHSILTPFVATFKSIHPNKKLVYIMTDGAALPIALSKNVETLKEKGLIDNTITYGNAFGGDYECVNIYTALITAKEVCDADCVIVCMGPGIAGTGTKYGFSGIDQGIIIDAVEKLGGKSYFIPRISFSDKRERHKGISHHSLTILSEITNSKTNVFINSGYESEKIDYIDAQLKETNILEKHNIGYYDYNDTEVVLADYGLKVKSMGRNFDEDSEFFIAGSTVAAKISEDICD